MAISYYPESPSLLQLQESLSSLESATSNISNTDGVGSSVAVSSATDMTIKNAKASTIDPSGGQDGDVWLLYTE